jgi:Domain of unknown function (DUF4406)
VTTLYIAGPMTGLPELNFPAFFEAERVLRAHGFDVLNPADRAGRTEGMPWSWYLRRGVRDVTESDGVALLPGWGDSRGARLEWFVARGLDLPAATVDGWLHKRWALAQ